MADNLYKDSWEIYKAHSEKFTDDFDYYMDFCKEKKTLELFAGYGRLINHLACAGIDIECVELEKNFANFIKIERDKIHVCSVLDFKPITTFERIIAGYNSFCLLTKDEEIKKFFQLLSQWLMPGGRASLSYYDHNRWHNAPSYTFPFKGMQIQYTPRYDLSEADVNRAKWKLIF